MMKRIETVVVGAGASGQQIAEELLRSGRIVCLSVGSHNKPRVLSQVYFSWACGGSTRVVRISSMALAPMQRM